MASAGSFGRTGISDFGMLLDSISMLFEGYKGSRRGEEYDYV